MKILIFLLGCFFSTVVFSQQIPSLNVEQVVEKYSHAKGVVVINFWSTWCKPCIEEIPYFIKVTDSLKFNGVSLLMVSLDTKKLYIQGKLKAFVQKKKWKSAIVWLNETNADHYCPAISKEWSGVIPVTLIVNPTKSYSRFYESSLTRKELIMAIEEAL